MPKRILIQAGHIAPREPGFEGGTGTVREQELTRAMRRRLIALLRADDRFEPIPAPGDIPDGIQVDAALFLHGDGAESAASRGRSFGFPEHPDNRKFAELLEERLSRIPSAPPEHEWNYTGGLREYYGYKRVPTPGPEVLIEHGFLTNPAEQRWLFANLGKMARAEYRAVCRFFNLEPRAMQVQDRRRLGFSITHAGAADRRPIASSLEFERIVDKINDLVAARITVRNKRMPIQPSP